MTTKEIMDIIYTEDPGWNEPRDLSPEDEERAAVIRFEIKACSFYEDFPYYPDEPYLYADNDGY